MAKSAEINVLGLPVVKQMLADRDRVIARLVNGWHPVEPVDDEPGIWVGERGWNEEPPENVMTDAEWEVLRPHLET